MTIYNKNGSLAVTIVQRVTTQTIQAMSNNSTNSTSKGLSNVPDTILLDDEDEFTARENWENVKKIVQVLYIVNIVVALLLSVVGLILFSTILDRKLREKSQMWYLYHLLLLSLFIGIILHTISHSGSIYRNKQTCYFVMYGAEYAFFAFGMNLVLVNTEILFTKILPLQKWESNPLSRFLVSILCGWLIVCFIIAHVVINNNKAKDGPFCFYINDPSVRKARFILRAIVPAIACFLFMVVSVVIYTLKRSRIMFATTSGELKEIRTDARDDESQWLKCTIFMNVAYMVREIAMMIVFFNSKIGGPDHYTWIVFIVFVHVQALYLVPFCLFFIADVRSALKNNALKIIEKASFGKLTYGGDLENLSVSFGNISHSDNC